MKYRTGYKYQLAADEHFQTPHRPDQNIFTRFIDLTTKGDMAVRGGYAWDGASGPTYDDDTNITPSLFHDAAYQLMREGHLPFSCWKAADDHLGEMCIERGMGKIRRWYWIAGLRLAGGSAAKPENVKETLTAP
jgi:hypothetical protein